VLTIFSVTSVVFPFVGVFVNSCSSWFWGLFDKGVTWLAFFVLVVLSSAAPVGRTTILSGRLANLFRSTVGGRGTRSSVMWVLGTGTTLAGVGSPLSSESQIDVWGEVFSFDFVKSFVARLKIDRRPMMLKLTI